MVWELILSLVESSIYEEREIFLQNYQNMLTFAIFFMLLIAFPTTYRHDYSSDTETAVAKE